MKTNIKKLFYTLIGCSVLALGTTSCQEEPTPEVGSKWKVTEWCDVTFINGEPDMYYYILCEEEITLEEVRNYPSDSSFFYSEYSSYFYDENTQLSCFTYQHNNMQGLIFCEVLERTDNTLKLRYRYGHRYEYYTDEEYDVYEYFQYITLVKE